MHCTATFAIELSFLMGFNIIIYFASFFYSPRPLAAMVKYKGIKHIKVYIPIEHL